MLGLSIGKKVSTLAVMGGILLFGDRRLFTSANRSLRFRDGNQQENSLLGMRGQERSNRQLQLLPNGWEEHSWWGPWRRKILKRGLKKCAWLNAFPSSGDSCNPQLYDYKCMFGVDWECEGESEPAWICDCDVDTLTFTCYNNTIPNPCDPEDTRSPPPAEPVCPGEAPTDEYKLCDYYLGINYHCNYTAVDCCGQTIYADNYTCDHGHWRLLYENPTCEETNFCSDSAVSGVVGDPTMSPSTLAPTEVPTNTELTGPPTVSPTSSPSGRPSGFPSTVAPTEMELTGTPTESTTTSPTDAPSLRPSTATPTEATAAPTVSPTILPTETPSGAPTNSPTTEPTIPPTLSPSSPPAEQPSNSTKLSPTSSLMDTASSNNNPSPAQQTRPPILITAHDDRLPPIPLLMTMPPMARPSDPPSSNPTRPPVLPPIVITAHDDRLPPIPLLMTMPPMARPSDPPSSNPTRPPVLREVDASADLISPIPLLLTMSPSVPTTPVPTAAPTEMAPGTTLEPTLDTTCPMIQPESGPDSVCPINPDQPPYFCEYDGADCPCQGTRQATEVISCSCNESRGWWVCFTTIHCDDSCLCPALVRDGDACPFSNDSHLNCPSGRDKTCFGEAGSEQVCNCWDGRFQCSDRFPSECGITGLAPANRGVEFPEGGVTDRPGPEEGDSREPRPTGSRPPRMSSTGGGG